MEANKMANSPDPFGGGWGDSSSGRSSGGYTGNSGGNSSGRGGNAGPGGVDFGRSTGQGNAASGNLMVSGKRVFDLKLFLVSAAAALLASVPSLILYDSLADDLFRPLVIALVMGSFFLITSIVIFLFQSIRGAFNAGINPGQNLILLLPCILGLMIGTLALEFIYEIGGRPDSTEPDAYVFVIDDSGSMNGSDSRGERYAAIDTILKDMPKDFPYAVYSFNNSVNLLRQLAPRSDRHNYNKPIVEGGTAIKAALGFVAEELETGTLKDTKNPKILLLSDGVATDIGMFTNVKKMLKPYVEAGVSISTLGLGGGADQKLMKKIAKGTGGVCISVDDVSDISSAMKTAMNESSTRDLLTLRSVPRLDFLYFIERILFLTLIGTAGSLLILNTAGLINSGNTVAAALVKAILGAVLVEILINTLGFGETLVDRLYFLLLGMIFATYLKKERGAGGYNGDAGQITERKVKTFKDEDIFAGKKGGRGNQGPFGFN